MTKWICKNNVCGFPCRCETGPGISPKECLLDRRCTNWKRDSTIEEKTHPAIGAIDERTARFYAYLFDRYEEWERVNKKAKATFTWKTEVDPKTWAALSDRVEALDKTVKELITAGQGQMARIQALEKKYKEHIPKLYKTDENIREEVWELRTRIKEHAKVIHELKCKV